MALKLSVIISTYNTPEWLEKVLYAYENQRFKSFELLIADDGSDAETGLLIDDFKKRGKLTLVRVWQTDKGFRKSEILNKAIVKTQSDYLVFSDGDCIPRSDFLMVHYEKRRRNHFVSGGYFKLPLRLSKSISKADIEAQRCFDLAWLKQRGVKNSFKNNKLSKNRRWTRFLDRVTPTEATWNGHNASGWRSDIVAANGFDQRMRYGGQDRELGERMMNGGIKAIQARYSAICVHLDHVRPYVDETDLRNNMKIRRKVKAARKTFTPYGIEKRGL
ncbi:MAG: glycosyltransferase [Flavobacteriales bacterium]